MADVIIACLSQKGGVGKSTLARLIARTYAVAGWTVKICDFNTRQLTSGNWVARRKANNVQPAIESEPYTRPSALRREDFNLVVADGRPDSDQTSLDIARLSDLIIVPTGLSMDDLEPQLRFANELVEKGVDKSRILFVLNKTVESKNASAEARNYLAEMAGYEVAAQEIATRYSYQDAQNHGYALSEVGKKVGNLELNADTLASEIVGRVNVLSEAA